MLDMQPAAMRDALEQLDLATRDHLEWHANLLRVIVCELPGDPSDLAPDAHYRCLFGQWYYGRAAVELRSQPGFEAIGVEHQRVHEAAAGILRRIAMQRPIERRSFDEFVVRKLRLHRELELLRRELRSALRGRDPLTGSYDRDTVLPELRRLRGSVHPGAQSNAIVLMDFDRLREVNETHGHPIGDALLVEAVRVVREHLRRDDRVFRYGGDEFLISLPEADLATAQSVVARVREGLARLQLFVPGAGATFQLTASFGLALLDPEVRVEDSVERAAQALLLAKTAGGNLTISWDPSVTTGRHWRRLEADESQYSIGADTHGREGS
jgi:diguanylate cyclase (GGDEF)-like protein